MNKETLAIIHALEASKGGFTVLPSSTVVMSVAGAYATGDYMGTSVTPQYFEDAVRIGCQTGIVKSIVISDKIITTNVAMELWLFSDTFVAPTDNGAWTITDAESLNCLGVIPISATGWYASGANQIYSDSTLSTVIKCTSNKLYYALVARGTTPAFTSSDLKISLGILQD